MIGCGKPWWADGFAKASVLAALTRHEPGSPEARQDLTRFLTLCAADPSKIDGWATDLSLLRVLAKGLAPKVAQRYGSIQGFEMSADFLTHKARKQGDEQSLALKRLALHSLAHLPSEWKGKRYRRTEGRGSEHARAEGERAEREKKGR